MLMFCNHFFFFILFSFFFLLFLPLLSHSTFTIRHLFHFKFLYYSHKMGGFCLLFAAESVPSIISIVVMLSVDTTLFWTILLRLFFFSSRILQWSIVHCTSHICSHSGEFISGSRASHYHLLILLSSTITW